MSAAPPSFGDDQPVVGEPASHRHQAVVVGEPSADEAPVVVGEPAFPNGLQGQEPVPLSSVDLTSANGVQPIQHMPLNEESPVSSSPVSSPPPTHRVEESPTAQQVPVTTTAASDSGFGEDETHDTEPPITENSIASSDLEAADTLNTPDAAASVEEGQGANIPEDTEVAHAVDEPHLPRREIPAENVLAAPAEDAAGDESYADASLTLEDISSKGPVDEQQQSTPQSAVEEKPSMEHSILPQAEADSGSVEGKQVVSEDNESDVKDANVDRKEHTVTSAVDDQARSAGTVQENKLGNTEANDRSSEVSEEHGVTPKEMQHGLSEAAPEPDDSSVKTSTQKSVDDVPTINPDLKNVKEPSVEAQLMDSSATLPGTRGIAVEECLANQSSANGDNAHEQEGDGDHASERELDLPQEKGDDDASAVSEKPSSGTKFPLISTGLVIAVVGVAIVAFTRLR